MLETRARLRGALLGRRPSSPTCEACAGRDLLGTDERAHGHQAGWVPMSHMVQSSTATPAGGHIQDRLCREGARDAGEAVSRRSP